jgi:hypothetical protein
MSVQEEKDEIDEVSAEVVAMFDGLEPDDRAVIITELVSRYCMACGHSTNDEGDCSNEDCLVDSDEEDEYDGADADEDDDDDDEDDEEDEDDEDTDEKDIKG